MQYGRTALEVIVAQALIIAAFFIAPVDLIASLGALTTGVITTALAAGVAYVLYRRHRARINIPVRKLKALRESAAY